MTRFLLAMLLMVPALVRPASAAPEGRRPICLSTVRINHTEVQDSKTILFYMNGGQVWKNTLKYNCPGLKFGGFAYSPMSSSEICENVQMIKALQSGSVCTLGEFKLYTPPAKKQSLR